MAMKHLAGAFTRAIKHLILRAMPRFSSVTCFAVAPIGMTFSSNVG